MTLDRSKFKATALKAQEQKDKEVQYLVQNKSGNRIERLEIDNGVNKFRIYGPHPEHEGATTLETKVINFLPYDKPERNEAGEIQKDDKGKVKTTRTVKGIFNSKVHGNAPKDLVEEYIKIAEELSKGLESEEDRKKYLLPVNGEEYKKGYKAKWKGIRAKTSWVCYASKIEGDKMGPLGELEFGKAVKNGYHKAAAIESVDDPLGTDACFTDIDGGRAMIVIYDENAQKPQDYYNISVDSAKVAVTLANGQSAKVDKTYPLSDEQLNHFLSVAPLINFRTAFKKRDFQFQLEGLRIFDEEAEMGVFDTDEFKQVIMELDEFFPEEETTSNDQNSNEEPNADKFDLMNKTELRQYAKDNETGINFKITDTEDVMRQKLREWEVINETPIQDSEPEVVEVAEPVKSQAVSSSANDKINALREKFKK